MEKAKDNNSIEAYLEYLKESKLKTKIDEALSYIGDLNASNYKDYIPNISDRLEIELLERDRDKVAMELHDNVGAQVTVIKFLLHSSKLEGDIIDNIKIAIEEVLSSLRTISRSLRTNYNDNEFDLKAAVLELQSTILKTNKLDFELIVKDIENIRNPQLEINIYRIIQELISNVIEHSKANNVVLSVEKTNEFLSISVVDDGKGFNIEKRGRGIGLKNINSRVQYYNGKIDLISSEIGTRIKIQLPIIK